MRIDATIEPVVCPLEEVEPVVCPSVEGRRVVAVGAVGTAAATAAESAVARKDDSSGKEPFPIAFSRLDAV